MRLQLILPSRLHIHTYTHRSSWICRSSESVVTINNFSGQTLCQLVTATMEINSWTNMQAKISLLKLRLRSLLHGICTCTVQESRVPDGVTDIVLAPFKKIIHYCVP